MRSSRLLAAAALMALPFGAPAFAAPAAPAAANAAASGANSASSIIPVQRYMDGGAALRGGGTAPTPGVGGGSRGGGGPGIGGGGFRGGGPGARGPGAHRGGPGYSRGAGRRHWAGRPGHGHRHWRGRRGGGLYIGAPYYYGAWGPSYYYDDYYYDDPVIVDDYDDDAVERCADRYRSFDRRTGTFLTYGGERKLCPYLR